MSFGETGYIIHTFCSEIYNNLLDLFASTSWDPFLSLLSIWLTCSGLWTFEGVCSVGGCTVTKHLILDLFPRIYIVLASQEDKTLKVDFINKQWKKEKQEKRRLRRDPINLIGFIETYFRLYCVWRCVFVFSIGKWRHLHWHWKFKWRYWLFWSSLHHVKCKECIL